MSNLYKVNDSRSEKHPFWTYIWVETIVHDAGTPNERKQEIVHDIFGQRWSGVPRSAFKVDEKEFNEAKKIYDSLVPVSVGDDVIIIECVSVPKRRNKIVEIKDDMVVLEKPWHSNIYTIGIKNVMRYHPFFLKTF